MTKKTEIESQIVEVLQQASDRRKKPRKVKDQVMKFLALTLYLLARLILASLIYWLFSKNRFSEGN